MEKHHTNTPIIDFFLIMCMEFQVVQGKMLRSLWLLKKMEKKERKENGEWKGKCWLKKAEEGFIISTISLNGLLLWSSRS